MVAKKKTKGASDKRVPLTPEQFQAKTTELSKQFPQLRHTSGKRTPERNKAVGGHPESKHLTGMANDFVGSMEDMRKAGLLARQLGLWFIVHDKGSGDHLHIQGVPPGYKEPPAKKAPKKKAPKKKSSSLVSDALGLNINTPAGSKPK